MKNNKEQLNKRRNIVMLAFMSIIIIILAAIFAYYWYSPVNFDRFLNYKQQSKYQDGLMNELTVYSTTDMVISVIPKEHKAKRKLLKSIEYSWTNFQRDFDRDFDLKRDAIWDLIWAYREIEHNYAKSLPLVLYYEKLINENKQILTKEDYAHSQLIIQLNLGQHYVGLKQYHRAIEAYKTVPRDFPYQDRSEERYDNLWSDVYKSIGNIYVYKLHNFDEGMKYYQLMDIDPRTLPKEKIGKLKNQDLGKQAADNHYESILAQYYAARDTRRHKEAQHILVNSLSTIEGKYGFIADGGAVFNNLMRERQFHGVLVAYRPKKLNSGIPPKGHKYNIIPFSQYKEEQRQLMLHGKPSNYKWL